MADTTSPEANYHLASQWWSDLPNIWTPVGWKDHAFRFNVFFNGMILAQPDMNSRTKEWQGQGVQLTFASSHNGKWHEHVGTHERHLEMAVAVALHVPPPPVSGGHAREPRNEIAQDVRIRVLIDGDRGGRVGAEDQNGSVFNLCTRRALGHLPSDVDEFLSACRAHLESHGRALPHSA